MMETGKFYKLTMSVRAWKPKEDVVTASTNVGAVRPDFRSGQQHYQQAFDMGDMWGAQSFKEVQLTAGSRLKLISTRPHDFFRFELMDDGPDKGQQVDVSVADVQEGTFVHEDDESIGANSGLQQQQGTDGFEKPANVQAGEQLPEPQIEWKNVKDELLGD